VLSDLFRIRETKIIQFFRYRELTIQFITYKAHAWDKKHIQQYSKNYNFFKLFFYELYLQISI
jgi:hypothetical protein